MKSNIHMDDVQVNRDRRFGAEGIYYPAMVHRKGAAVPALFTEAQIKEAIRRAAANPEDVAAAQRPAGMFGRLASIFGRGKP